MITFLQLIGCHWVRVTTTVAYWARLPHVVSWSLRCGAVVAVLAPPLPNTHSPIPSPDTDYAHVPPAFIPGIEWPARRAPLVPPADVVDVDEPGAASLFAGGVGVLMLLRNRKKES